MAEYNVDYSFVTRNGNDAFVEFLDRGTWKRVKPDPLVDTNWADHVLARACFVESQIAISRDSENSSK